MYSVVVMSLVVTALPVVMQAKPLITGSEETTTQLCLRGEAAPERLTALCKAALKESGASKRERSEVFAALGQALLDMDDNDGAAPHFLEAMRLDPTSADAINGLAWARWGEDRDSEAAELFQRSVDLRPTAQGLAGLASALWNSEAADLDTVAGYLDAALAIDPEYIWAMREQGWIFLDAGVYDKALSRFDAAINIYPDDWNAHYGRSRTFEELEQLDDSLLAVNEAVRSNPDNPWGYAQRAFLLRELDRNAQAIKDADRVIEMRPDAPAGYLQKALALAALGQRSRALEIFGDGVARGIEDGLLLYWYADVLSDDGDMDKAQDIVGRAIIADAGDPSYYMLRAWIALKQEAWQMSMDAAESALALDPELAYPHYYAAVAIANTGPVETALARFDRAMDAGIGRDMIGVFAADLIAAGRILSAVKLRSRY